MVKLLNPTKSESGVLSSSPKYMIENKPFSSVDMFAYKFTLQKDNNLIR